jgi:hypothetical protein
MYSVGGIHTSTASVYYRATAGGKINNRPKSGEPLGGQLPTHPYGSYDSIETEQLAMQHVKRFRRKL